MGVSDWSWCSCYLLSVFLLVLVALLELKSLGVSVVSCYQPVLGRFLFLKSLKSVLGRFRIHFDAAKWVVPFLLGVELVGVELGVV
ncbi:hypothetical protein HNR60_002960 [Rhodopseudomonas rhenobacensis]|uniref:Uncharacterized protein n=1 Tax=Rhodopseudomonas rhenobacensis TaxID=87461 RepID=A0A7W8DZM4_9BRAD|nr:hypothetical protein [Rhodopseudomonas rhenobacensis]MBB5048198.1 hypothetical protein [Rhodopseudomonas rhenobacensis]